MNSSAEQFLNSFLELIDMKMSNVALLEHLKNNNILHVGFEERYLLNNLDRNFRVVERFEKNSNYWVFYLESEDGSPYRIEIIKSDFWNLKSFMFLCQSCFGEDKECNVCGGDGWGVL